jgi:hypothetical protein
LNVAVRLSEEGRTSIFFLRRVDLKEANALDSNGVGDKGSVNRRGCRRDQAMTQKPVIKADIAKGVFLVGLDAYKLRTGMRTNTFNAISRAGLFPVRVSLYAVDFGRQKSPRKDAKKNAMTPAGLETEPEQHTISKLPSPGR